MFIFGGLYLFFCVLVGGLLAVLLDQHIRLENFFRTSFLYPMSLSLVVTGLAWQWILNPTLGLQKLAHDLGFHEFTLNWLGSSRYAIYAVVLAAVWHGSGLIMVLFLAGLRAVDEDIWKSIHVEGIPAWQAYLFIILPQLRSILLAAILLLMFNVIRSFDIVVALTSGGPGFASDVPAKFIYDYFFARSNIARGAAAAVCTVMTVLLIILPYLYYELRKEK
jgi:glucose/mannose transport system permease protein